METKCSPPFAFTPPPKKKTSIINVNEVRELHETLDLVYYYAKSRKVPNSSSFSEVENRLDALEIEVGTSAELTG